MATLQLRLDDDLKKSADALFPSLGMDTSTAVRIFLNAAVEYGGIPFEVRSRKRSLTGELAETFADVTAGRNLHGPFATGEEAVASMLAD